MPNRRDFLTRLMALPLLAALPLPKKIRPTILPEGIKTLTVEKYDGSPRRARFTVRSEQFKMGQTVKILVKGQMVFSGQVISIWRDLGIRIDYCEAESWPGRPLGRWAHTMVFLMFLLTLATPGRAQTHVDLGLDAAKTYSVSAGAWVPATVPSVAVSRAGANLTLAVYFDRGYYFEHDVSLAYERDFRDRWTATTSLARYTYRDRSSDRAWSVGLRMRVR